MCLTGPLAGLISKGVSVPHPNSVFVDSSVDVDRIHASVTLLPGTRLEGATLSIGPDCVIGKETPATVIDCQLGKGVILSGGFHQGSVFLDGSAVGSSAHIRPGCLLEEEASVAHAVGLKQTLLFPFVTLGSVINFCDVWMTGGTSRKNHSEVGSSFIHFNFTPHSDKATPSLLGDPATGILLNQPPVFLGGQGGIVGPVEMSHGVIQAAGSICRKDLLDEGHLYQSSVPQERWQPYQVGQIKDVQGRIRKNLTFMGSLVALRSWYTDFRSIVMSPDASTQACLEGATSLLDGSVQERCKQLEKMMNLAGESLDLMERLRQEIAVEIESSELRKMAERVLPKFGNGYTQGIQALDPEDGEVIVNFFKRQQQRYVNLADR